MKPSDVEAVSAIDAKITGTARPEYYRHKLEVANLHDAQINASLVAEADGLGHLLIFLAPKQFVAPNLDLPRIAPYPRFAEPAPSDH
jgi:hypothetical protein